MFNGFGQKFSQGNAIIASEGHAVGLKCRGYLKYVPILYRHL